MPYNPAQELLIQCLKHVTAGDAGYVENPAVEFTKMAKHGDFDQLSDDEYNILLHKVETLAKLWHGQPRRAAGEILMCFLERIDIPSERLKTDVVKPLMEWYNWDSAELDDHGNPLTDEPEISAALDAAFTPRRPKDIRNAIAVRVLGQPEAAKAAAMIVHGTLAGRRTNAVFAGPSGCGKSEIWRCLAREYPGGLIRMIDASRLAPDGWKGSTHIRDAFEGLDPAEIRRRGLILVLDEADKILCERTEAVSETAYHALIQNCLLKMLDGDVIEFGVQDGKPAFSVDCSRVSVVMLGAFETLLTAKTASKAKHIGFGAAPEAAPPSHKDITYDDLIRAGTRREIAGRVNRIVAMSVLGASDYKRILMGPVLSDLEKDFKRRIAIGDAAADMLSGQAVTSGLGVRWAKSSIRNAIEDALFDADMPENNYILTLRDGKLCCEAMAPFDEDPAEPRRAVPVGCPGSGDWSGDDGIPLPF